MSEEFGLIVHFTLKDGAADAFDKLVADTISDIDSLEPGTLIYLSHQVEGQPSLRIFYELYRNKDAFEDHENQPHTRRFLAERDAYIEKIEVERLATPHGVRNG